ncbi:hypothetical protein D3C87_1350700 [compost metagenome]
MFSERPIAPTNFSGASTLTVAAEVSSKCLLSTGQGLNETWALPFFPCNAKLMLPLSVAFFISALPDSKEEKMPVDFSNGMSSFLRCPIFAFPVSLFTPFSIQPKTEIFNGFLLLFTASSRKIVAGNADFSASRGIKGE